VHIPWWAKLGPKLVLSRLPFAYSFWQRLGLFRHGSMDDSEYAIGVFRTHAERTGLIGQLRGKTILELGPGDSIGTAIISASHGAAAILVDTGPFVRSDVGPCIDLAAALKAEGLQPPDLRDCPTIPSILERCHARYLTNGLAGLKQIEDQSVDLIFSQAVLEHVRKREFLDTMRECRRILKPGGVCSHQIDLRDHLEGALNNLRFSDALWESEFFVKSGFYTNRIQYSRMLGLFHDAGFQVPFNGARRWDALPTPRRKLAREFQMVPDEELCVSGFDVVLR
jgi:SAM-dependent methyltransferase